MAEVSPAARGSFIERLSDPGLLLAVELRPPRSNLPSSEGLEAWIDANHSLRRLSELQTVVFLTDNAVGRKEEEHLQHLLSNVGSDLDANKIVPFLTCKHTLDYCAWYAQRAAQGGFRGLVVVGGDSHDGVPRCFPHAYQLRRSIREKLPELLLGGWANPYREATEQVGFLTEASFEGNFFLTQVVSHFNLAPVERFLSEADRQGLKLPGVFGVFYFRSDNPRTFARLSRFMPVPEESLKAAFARGATADEVCAQTIEALLSFGVRKFYISNLPTADAHRVLTRLRRMVEER